MESIHSIKCRETGRSIADKLDGGTCKCPPGVCLVPKQEQYSRMGGGFNPAPPDRRVRFLDDIPDDPEWLNSEEAHRRFAQHAKEQCPLCAMEALRKEERVHYAARSWWKKLAMAFALAGILLILFGSLKVMSQSIVRKDGQCPSGWRSSAHFCIAPSRSGEQCIRKGSGTCPSGYRQSGAYCCA